MCVQSHRVPTGWFLGHSCLVGLCRQTGAPCRPPAPAASGLRGRLWVGVRSPCPAPHRPARAGAVSCLWVTYISPSWSPGELSPMDEPACGPPECTAVTPPQILLSEPETSSGFCPGPMALSAAPRPAASGPRIRAPGPWGPWGRCPPALHLGGSPSHYRRGAPGRGRWCCLCPGRSCSSRPRG